MKKERNKMKLRHITSLSGLIFLHLINANAHADASINMHVDKQACNDGEAHYKSCDSQTGWYIGSETGYAITSVDNNNLNRFYHDNGITANTINVDDSDIAFSFFGGYQFSTHFAVEGGYLNLGERAVTFSGESTDLIGFYDNAEHIYPQSGKGLSVAVVGSFPLSESFKVSAKLGYFDWEGDYITSEQGANVGRDAISGEDIWFGGEVNYRVNDDFQVYASAQRFALSRHTTTNIALGIRYYFG